jgi:hypothetical protein
VKAIRNLSLAGAVTTAIAVSACASEAPESSEAPTATMDQLEAADEGDSFNGWTQSGLVFVDLWQYSNNYIYHNFARSFGDSTRGGGACFVRANGVSCSSDPSCTTIAQGTFGGAAFGYCYQGQCYSRPGSAATYCSQNPNRGPGFVTKGLTAGDVSNFDGAMIGCMTKTAGPNAACGGNNGAFYMRFLGGAYYDVGPIY